MTDLKKAKEIIEKYSGSTFHNAGQAYAWLEDRISAALAEARKEKQDQYKSFRNGYQAGLEEAAKVAEENEWKDEGNDNCLHIAFNIRDLIKERK